MTKPVRFDELLDWLGKKLTLQWQANAPAAPAAAPARAAAALPHLQALQEVVALGYPRGVQRVLDQIESEQPACAAWLEPMRRLAQSFQFEHMSALIRHALANHA